MDDATFLDGYDPGAHDRPSVTVDVVAMGILDGAPAIVLTRRPQPPFAGCWALPGGFVGVAEELDDAARRVLAAKGALSGVSIEQLYTFGAVDRDPRMRIVSVAYLALLPPAAWPRIAATGDRRIARIAPDGIARIDGEAVTLAFDHADILRVTLSRLRGRIAWADTAFALLPDRFTLRELQGVHEAILGQPLNKSAFRRRMLDRGDLYPTGTREGGAAFRPAELYTHGPKG